MQDILKKRLKDSVGKCAKIFLQNNFRYEGKITNCDNNYVEILQRGEFKIIPLSDVKDVTIEVRE
jgi:sRNA-binding regulator protein Hfq